MCVLRASGKNFDVRSFLASTSLRIAGAYERGDLRRKSRPDGERCEESGFVADVSEKPWSDLPGQLQDARRFLAEFEAELLRLRGFPGVEGIELDFPTDLRIGNGGVIVQSDRLPADLLLAVGALGVDIVITTYPPTDDDVREATGRP
jgi:hypothetical protein